MCSPPPTVHHQVKFIVSRTPDTDAFTIKGIRGRRLLVDAGGLQLTINMAKAIKFDKEVDRVKWAHLNVNLNNGTPTPHPNPNRTPSPTLPLPQPLPLP